MEDRFEFNIEEYFLFHSLCKNSNDYIFIGDIKTSHYMISENMMRDFGFKSQYVSDFLNIYKSRIHNIDQERVERVCRDYFKENLSDIYIEFQVKLKNEEYIWVNCKACLKRDDVTNEPIYVIATLHNLEYDGQIDNITGIFTYEKGKKYFEKKLLNEDYRGSILLIGIDNFSSINTLNSYAFGNLVLRNTVQDIQKMLPKQASIYRFEGDQFLILGQDMNEESMHQFYLDIKQYVSQNHRISNQVYSMGVSGSIVSFPNHALIWDELIKCATVALKKAKESGKNKCLIFKNDMLASRLREQRLSEILSESVKNNFQGFKVVYQPICDVSTFTVVGAEALLRFNNDLETYLPDEFIPILENSRLIIPVGLWVLEQAIITCKEWLEKIPNFVINVNVSYIQLHDMIFCDKVIELLDKHNIDSEHITLELTESHFLIDTKDMDTLEKLRKIRLQIAMDDFGTGYSSVARLTEFNVDIVKIDKSLIQTLNFNSFNYEFVESVIRLCHNAKMKVCVEGVERQEELRIISLFGADFIQGFYISKPVEKECFYDQFIYHTLNSEGYILSTAKEKRRQELITDSRLLRNLMDATPLGLIIWSKDIEVIACNNETVLMLEAKDEAEVCSNFFDYSTEIQANGKTSLVMAEEEMKKSLELGYNHFSWLHKSKTGKIIPTEVTVVRIEYQDDIILTTYARDMRKQLELENDLRNSYTTIRAILDVTPLCLNLWNSRFENTMCNKKAVELFELKDENEYIEKFFKLSPKYQPDGQLSDEKAAGKIQEAFEKGSSVFNWIHCKLDGEEIPAEITLIKIVGLDSDGQDMVAGYTRDLRPQIALESVQKRISQRMKAIIDSTPLTCLLWDLNGHIIDCNQVAKKLFNASKKDIVKDFDSFYPRYQPDGVPSYDKKKEKFKEVIETGSCTFEWVYMNTDNEEIPCAVTLVKIEMEDEEDMIVAYSQDLREIHNTLELNSRLIKLAYYDILTGCSSRSSFMEELSQVDENKVEDTSVYIFDFDNFKKVNDTYGHEAGDLVLKTIVSKVCSLLPKNALVGRYGGDEFMIQINRLSQNEVKNLMDTIIMEVGKVDILYENQHIHNSISIGGVFWKKHETPNEVLKRADAALYDAKKQGRNRYVLKI